MDVSTLEYGRSIDAMDEGYEQIEMSIMGGSLNTPEMMKRQAGVSGDTIYMGGISVYPKEEYAYQPVMPQYHMGYPSVNQPPVQQYYDPTIGVMYVPMYPVMPTPSNVGVVHTPPTPAPTPMISPVKPAVNHTLQVIPTPQNTAVNHTPPVGVGLAPPTPTPTMSAATPVNTVTQETTMYPATSVTKMTDIFGEDKKYSRALMELQADSEYKVAIHANAGKNGKRYMYNFSHMDKTKQLLNWNFGAFCFGPLWYAYRKMPIRAFFLLMVILYGMSTSYALPFVFIMPILVGAFSDKFYKNRLDYMIDKQFMMSQEKRDQHINTYGGASGIYVLMFVLITTVIAIGTYVYILPEVEVLKTTYSGVIIFLQNILGLY